MVDGGLSPRTSSAGTNTAHPSQPNPPYHQARPKRTPQNAYSVSPHSYIPPGIPSSTKGGQESPYGSHPAPSNSGAGCYQRPPPRDSSGQYNRMVRPPDGNGPPHMVTNSGKMTEL